MDLESSEWRKDTVILHDNARYATSEEMREYFRKMAAPVLYSGPYSFSAAPIELLFGHVKRGDVNPERVQTGKKVRNSFHFSDFLVLY